MKWPFSKPKYSASEIAAQLEERYRQDALMHGAWDTIINKALAAKGYGDLQFTTLSRDFDEAAALGKNSPAFRGKHIGMISNRDETVSGYSRINELEKAFSVYPIEFGANPASGGTDAAFVLVEPFKRALGVEMQCDFAGQKTGNAPNESRRL